MNIPLSPVEAHERTIGQVLSDSYAFEIPPYQRPYAWEVEQASELLGDLVQAMDDTDANGGMYFLGSIVLIKQPTSPESKVVDGQQRLTTITILLSVIRDLTTDQRQRYDRESYVYQNANEDRGVKERFRLLLRERDRAFFAKYIQKPGTTNQIPDANAFDGSQQRLIENARHFRERLSVMQEGRRNQLIAFIVQRCYLVVVAVPTADAARRIFTVLNARGMDLTATDILKASLLERAGTSREAELARRWEAVEQAVGRDKFVELFGHIRMIFEREKPRSALEAGFSKFVPPFNSDPDDFVSNVLEPIFEGYALVTNSKAVQSLFGAEAAKAIRSLERIDSKDWLPPVLLRLWKRKPDDAADVAKFLIALERLAYFLFVSRCDVNERIARFTSVMNQFDDRAEQPIGSGGLTLSDAEQHLFLMILSGPLYRKSRVCRPVLQRLDEALSSVGLISDAPVSIEHVLPQTVEAESEWARLFPDDLQREEWTHRLANLVFLTKRINTRASNWDFSRKKQEYFLSRDGTSPFPLTQSVLHADRWTPEYLTLRQKELIATLTKVWELRADSVLPEASDENGITGRMLNREWGVNARHALYRKDGTWYHVLTHFPGALFDSQGYILFRTAEELAAREGHGMLMGREKNWLNVPGGISTMKGYVRIK